MKMIRAYIRPDQEEKVIRDLERNDFVSYTRWEVIGRGKQRGTKKGNSHYLELYKTCLMIVVEDDHAEKAIKVINKNAHTGKTGDGKIFVSPVESAITIRTGKEEL